MEGFDCDEENRCETTLVISCQMIPFVSSSRVKLAEYTLTRQSLENGVLYELDKTQAVKFIPTSSKQYLCTIVDENGVSRAEQPFDLSDFVNGCVEYESESCTVCMHLSELQESNVFEQIWFFVSETQLFSTRHFKHLSFPLPISPNVA